MTHNFEVYNRLCKAGLIPYKGCTFCQADLSKGMFIPSQVTIIIEKNGEKKNVVINLAKSEYDVLNGNMQEFSEYVTNYLKA